MKNLIVGYSFQRKNRLWVIAAVIIGLILLVFWFLLSLSSLENSEQKKTKAKKAAATPKETIVTTTTLKKKEVIQPQKAEKMKSAVVRSIQGNLPGQASGVFAPGEKVYFYTHIMLQFTPQVVKHVWVAPDGKTHAVVDLRIVNQPADTWSFIYLPPESEGKWQVKVMLGEKIIDKAEFWVE